MTSRMVVLNAILIASFHGGFEIRIKPGVTRLSIVLWRACGDSNAGPSAPEADTLSTELQAQFTAIKARLILPSNTVGVKHRKADETIT